MSHTNPENRVPAISPEEFYNRTAGDDPRVPEVLRESRAYDGDSYEVPTERYTSKKHMHLEDEKLWSRVWQMTCREEEIPEVGDMYTYEVGIRQYVVVRAAPDTIKAYPNSCPHRGRKLVDCNKRASKIRCPFHGLTWNLDGRIASIPCAWEFSHIEDPEQWRLREAKVATWGGFVFINPSPEAEPLMDFLGDIDRHYERYGMADRFINGHVRKVVPCNWKVAQEAFLEAYHAIATHPQLMAQGAHTDMKYDCYDNYSRALGVYYDLPNYYTGFEPGKQDFLDSVMDHRMDQERTLVADEKLSVREQMAAMARANYEKTTGESAEHFADTEMIDICFMSIFPNFHPWTLFNRICYVFRPYKDDPDRSWMDIFQLNPYNKKEGRPDPAPVHFLTEEQDFTDAPEMGAFLARIGNQDSFNFGPLQEGLKASATQVVRFSQYQESRIRHFHDLLEQWVGK